MNRVSSAGASRYSRTAAEMTEALLLLFLACLAANVGAQEGVVGRNFRVVPGYYPAPHERQMRSLLEGASAQVSPADSKVLIVKDIRLRTFSESGQPEIQVEAPECRYHQDQRTISSPGVLRVRTADAGFSVEGRGFEWREAESTLVISNDVVTVLQAGLLRGNVEDDSGERESSPIQIASHTFEYDRKEGRGTYAGNVRVTGTNLFLAGGVLTIEVPVNAREFRSISARDSVRLEYAGVHATGREAVYRQDTGILQVTGSPAWKTEFREGKADSVTIDRTNRLFRAEGNAFLRLSGPELGGAGLLAALPEAEGGRGSTNRIVEISSADYVIHTNSARFAGGVKVVDRGEPMEEPVKLDCQTLSLAFTGTNELQRIAAEGGVVIARGDQQFSGAQATYDGPAQLLSLQGEPRWQAGNRRGYGRVIEIDAGREEMLVRGDACLELPAGELSAVSTATNLPAAAALGTNSAPARICADEYSVTRQVAVFLGAVEIQHPQMRWTCERLAIGLPAAGGTVDRILAEPDVRFDFLDRQGRNLHGRGDQAVYTRRVTSTATNSWLELFGAPAMLRTENGMTVKNRVLRFDLNQSKFVVPAGSYRILGPTNSSSLDTNMFRLPTDVSR